MAVPRDLQFIFTTLGIYLCYLLYGVVQERLTRTRYGPEKERFTHTLFLLLIQTIFNGLAAVIALLIKGQPLKDKKTPTFKYQLMAVSYLSAMYLSNAALQYVDYPTQALAKSCKPIPVLIFGIFMLRRRYHVLKYFCILLITCGIGVFMLSVPKKAVTQVDNGNGEYSFGVLLLISSLLLDGFTGPWQEKVINSHNPSAHHLMLWNNVWAACFVFVGILISGDLWPALEFCSSHPAVWRDVFVFAVVSALGQNFIFYMVTAFGSLLLSIVTTTRKFFTILFSVVLFGNVLVPMQWLGIVMVFLGLGVDIVASKRKKGVKTD